MRLLPALWLEFEPSQAYILGVLTGETNTHVHCSLHHFPPYFPPSAAG